MSASIACPPVRICGRFFWKGDDRFFVRGVAYQVRSTLDPISDDRLAELREDILLFKELGLNTLFVYFIDNTKDHAQAMKLLEEAGIYVLTAVSTPSNSISRLAPIKSYNPVTMASLFKTVNIMASFPNTLGILAGNEVSNNDVTLPAAAVLKAVCKSYDLKELSNVTKPVYDDLLHRFSGTPIPIFLSEYGSNSQKPRIFHETTALYSSSMSRIFSGGCVYEFWQNANGYGLVKMLKHRDDKQTTHIESMIYERRETDRGVVLILRDFINYKARLAEIGNIGIETEEESTEPGRELGKTDVEAIGLWQATFQVPESCVDWASSGNV
ncbi:glycoside hydrolase family 72 protein [Bipolaris zeicola 26-R-13]|uniref:1,3-beta-glucanosyltransferase n=1 Tax=Cochliobolus carbonum (strain 26-R-13) TaxID=930089 RepID=W6YGD9_COCC2|nr:glycoside hydrolase family 72 protein [Bipolaris zeicola 26-R-13]EUC38592.1 glycoside hydrolase family 72 protein [Bipolaris zeicola 26-R-13]